MDPSDVEHTSAAVEPPAVMEPSAVMASELEAGNPAQTAALARWPGT